MLRSPWQAALKFTGRITSFLGAILVLNLTPRQDGLLNDEADALDLGFAICSSNILFTLHVALLYGDSF
jgi:hypothetical protein